MKRLSFKPRSTFVHDLNHLAKIDRSIIPEIKDSINILCEDGKLPVEYDDHPLHGLYESYRDFHVRETSKGESASEKNDVIVIYKIRYHELTVVGIRAGAHSILFSGPYSKPKSNK